MTTDSFCHYEPLNRVLNTQMIIDWPVTPGDGGKTYLTISKTVLQRMIDGKTLGIAIKALGAINASFYGWKPGRKQQRAATLQFAKIDLPLHRATQIHRPEFGMRKSRLFRLAGCCRNSRCWIRAIRKRFQPSQIGNYQEFILRLWVRSSTRPLLLCKGLGRIKPMFPTGTPRPRSPSRCAVRY